MAHIVELPKTVTIVARCGYDWPRIVTPNDFLEGIHV